MTVKATPAAVVIQKAFLAYYDVLWENREVLGVSWPEERIKADRAKHQRWLDEFEAELTPCDLV